MSFLKKKRVKLQFDITIHSVEWTFGYSKLAGKSFKIEWKRSDVVGNSKILKLEDGNDKLSFEQKVPITMNLGYKDLKAGKFESKKVTFTLLIEGEKKDDAMAGRVDLDLASVANPGKFEPEQKLKLLGKDKKENTRNPTLVLTVKTEWLKVDGKKLVKPGEKAFEDDLMDLGDLDKDIAALSRKKSKKGKSLEQELLEKQAGAGGAATEGKIEVNGQVFDLVETDEISEMEMSDADEGSGGSDEEPDPFAEEEAKEKDEIKKKFSKKSLVASGSSEALATSTEDSAGDKKSKRLSGKSKRENSVSDSTDDKEKEKEKRKVRREESLSKNLKRDNSASDSLDDSDKRKLKRSESTRHKDKAKSEEPAAEPATAASAVPAPEHKHHRSHSSHEEVTNLHKQIESLTIEKEGVTREKDAKIAELTKELKQAKADFEKKGTELATAKRDLEVAATKASASESSGASALKDLELKFKQQIDQLEAENKTTKHKLQGEIDSHEEKIGKLERELAAEKANVSAALASTKDGEQATESIRQESVQLRDEIDHLKDQLQAESRQRTAAEQEAKEHEAEVAKLTSQIDSLRRHNGDSLHSEQTKVAELERQVTELQEALAQTTDAHKVALKASADIAKQKESLHDELVQAISTLETTKKEEKSLHASEESLKHKLEESMQHTEELEAEIEEKATALKEKDRALDRAQSELQQLKGAQAAAGSDSNAVVQQLQDQMNELKSKVEAVEDERDKAKKELAKTKSKVEKLEKDLEDAEQELDENDGKLKASQAKARELEGKLKDHDSLKQKVVQLEAEIEEKENASKSKASSAADQEEEKQQLRSQLKTLKSDLEEAKKELEDVKKDLDEAEGEVDDLKKAVKTKTQENSTLQKNIKGSEEKIEELNQELKEAKERAREAKPVAAVEVKTDDSALKALQKQLEEEIQQNTQLEAQLKDLKEQSEIVAKKSAQLEGAVQKAADLQSQQAASAATSTATQQTEVEEYKRKVAKLEKELEEANNDADEMEDEIKELNTKLEQLKKTSKKKGASDNDEEGGDGEAKKEGGDSGDAAMKIKRLEDELEDLQNKLDEAVEESENVTKKFKAAEEELKAFRATKGPATKGGDKKSKELELLVNSIYTVTTVKPGTELDKPFQEVFGFLKRGNYFTNTEFDFLKMLVAALHHQALMNNTAEQLVGWLNQVSAMRDITVDTFFEDAEEGSSTETVGIKTKLELAGKKGDDSEGSDEDSATAEHFVKELETVQLHIFRALVNHAYKKLRPIVRAAVLEQKKPELKRLTQVLTNLFKAFSSTQSHVSVRDQFFGQVFYFIDCSTLNALVDMGSKFCTASNAFNVKLSISHLEQWGMFNLKASGEKMRQSLKYSNEATNLLVMDKSPATVSDDIRNEVWPSLNPAQVLSIFNNFKPDSISPAAVPDEVKTLLRKLSEPTDNVNLNENALL